MNVGKNVDNGSLFAGLDRAMASQLSQIELYCEIGRLICARPEKGAAAAAAAYLTEKYPNLAGFSARNVRRMRDFYRMYEKAPKLLAQAMRLGWTQNVVILEADLTMEERAWYLRAAEQFGWSKLTLQKKIAEAAHLAKALDPASEMCYNVRRTLHQSRSPRSGDFKLRMQFGKTQSGLLLCYTEQDEAITIREALIKSTCRIDEQIFRLSKPQNRRNTVCISRFWGKNRREICRQDVCGDLFRGSLVLPRTIKADYCLLD